MRPFLDAVEDAARRSAEHVPGLAARHVPGDSTEPAPAALSQPLRIDLRTLLWFTLTTAGAALVAIAVVDWFAHDFAVVDIVAYEDRLHPDLSEPGATWRRLPSQFDPWWRPFGRPELMCAGYGLVLSLAAGLLARVRRPARVVLTLAAVCIAGLVALVAAAEQPGFAATANGWLRYRGTPSTWIDHREQSVLLLLLVAPAFVWACGRFARWRGAPTRAWLATAALGLPPVLGLAAVALLWRVHGGFTATGHEGWVTLVHLTRGLLVAVAVVLPVVAARVLRGGPGPRARGLLFAAGVLALGVSAVVASHPHRRTIDALYPLPDPGAGSLNWPYLRPPWRLDVPMTTTCVRPRVPHLEGNFLVYRDATGELRVGDGDHEHGSGADTLARLDDEILRGHWPWSSTGPHPVALLVAADVPMADLAPFLAELRARDLSPMFVAGLHIQDVPTIRGPAVAWFPCAIGELLPAALEPRAYPPGTTWSTVLADPELVTRE